MSQRHPSTCTQTPTIYTRTANSAAIGSASTTATRPAGGAHISTLHGQQHCPRKLNRSSRDFRLPVEKEAGGWRLGQSKVSLSSEGCSRGERPNYAPQGAWGRHPVTGAGMANFLVTQPDASSAGAPEKGDCCHHNENMPAHRSCFHTPAITLSALTCAGGRRAAFG